MPLIPNLCLRCLTVCSTRCLLESGPRYTSYPTAVQFVPALNASEYTKIAQQATAENPTQPLSLYFHIPFCDTICYYCGCSKIVTKDKSKAVGYVELLKKEIKMQGALFAKDRPVVQIHWGGGTPTFLEDDVIKDIFTTLKQNFNVPEGDEGEFGIEVDPRTVDSKRIAQLRAIGFNRISVCNSSPRRAMFSADSRALVICFTASA